MKALKFNLKGDFAFFAKPEINNVRLTFSHIHKIALLGMFGAIIGLDGYKSLDKGLYPEFYEKLKDFKIAIVPNAKNKYFYKKIMGFNDSTGCSNKGDALQISEQWLMNPDWDIYVMENDTGEYQKLKEYLFNNKCEFIPYLGKNDHPAHISNVEEIDIKKISEDEVVICDSLVADFEIASYRNNTYLMEEEYPVELNDMNLYNYKVLFLLDAKIKGKNIYKADNKFVYFI